MTETPDCLHCAIWRQIREILPNGVEQGRILDAVTGVLTDLLANSQFTEEELLSRFPAVVADVILKRSKMSEGHTIQ